MKEKSPETFANLWSIYPSIADLRKFAGKAFLKLSQQDSMSEAYPYFCEVVNGWWKYSLDEEISKLTIK